MKQSLKKIGRKCILDNNRNFEENDYAEYLMNCGEKIERDEYDEPIIDKDVFYDWCQEENRIGVEDDLDNIKYYAPYNTQIRAEGTLGLWNGRVHVFNDFKSVYAAIWACIENTEFFNAHWEDGKIYVTAIHHDGTNKFVVRCHDRRKKLPYLYV